MAYDSVYKIEFRNATMTGNESSVIDLFLKDKNKAMFCGTFTESGFDDDLANAELFFAILYR